MTALGRMVVATTLWLQMLVITAGAADLTGGWKGTLVSPTAVRPKSKSISVRRALPSIPTPTTKESRGSLNCPTSGKRWNTYLEEAVCNEWW